MARPSIPVDVIGNTAQLRKQIEELSKTPIVMNVQAAQVGGRGKGGGLAAGLGGAEIGAGLAAGSAAANSFNRPLGKITGNLSEIDKSLGAANARVIAFGASAGAIFAVQNAVRGLFTSFVNTEKQLASINTVLNLDQGGLKSFGKQIFKTAGDTGQSFDTASEAALEFSRQGLGVEETTKRTRDALILSRLSGLDAASSVDALTASVNSYQKEGLTTGQVVNKLANVDAGFAVSSADLAEALSRVGSSAQDAGISFDELIALVTSAQQITARGGSVIGNSLKTIFTRLGRTETRETLSGLGISLVDEQGNEKNQIALLKDLANVYGTLGSEQKNAVAEQVGGVFQLNILKAALSDLGRSYSVYDRALNTSLGSTNQAEKRNEQLNQTLSGLGTQTLANVQGAASTIGEGLFAPAAKNVLNITNTLAESVNTADSSGIGAQLGQGIINGLGSFLSGPGLAVVGAVLAKLFGDFAKYGATAAQSLLGLDSAAKSQAAIQQSVGGFLQKNAGLYSSIVSGQTSATAAAKQYLQVINQQTAALQAQSAIVKSVAQAVVANVGGGAKSAVPVIVGGAGAPKKTKFAGFIPNFGIGQRAFYQNVENAGASQHKNGYRAGILKGVTVHDGMGGKTRAWMTSRESKKTWTNEDGFKATMITPPNGFSAETMTASAGFIPNFARPTPQQFIDDILKGAPKITPQVQAQYPGSVIDKQRNVLTNQNGQIVYNPNIPTDQQWGQYLRGARLTEEEKVLQKGTRLKKNEQVNQLGLISNKPEGVSLVYGAEAGPSIKSAQLRYPSGKEYAEAYQGSVMTSGLDKNAMKGSLAQINPKERMEQAITDLSNDISGQLGLKTKLGTGDIPNIGSVTSAVGTAFEQALINYVGRQVKQAQNKNVDFANPGFIKNIFHNIPGQYEAKENVGGELIQDVIKKYLNNINEAAKLEAKYNKQKSSVTSAGGAAVGAAGKLQKATGSISRSGVQTYTQRQFDQILAGEGKTGKNQLAADLQSGRIVISDAMNAGFIPQFAPNIAAIQKLIKQGATAGERQAAMAAMSRIQTGALSKLGSGDKLSKFRELLYGPKRGFNLEAIRVGDLSYKPLLQSAKELGLSQRDLQNLLANPSAIDQLRNVTPMQSGLYSGFIPNFAKIVGEAQQRALDTERSYGMGAVLDEYRGMQYVRQPGQSSNFKSMIKQDHPEGLKQAIKNSAVSQGLSRGFIPNFAPEDEASGPGLVSALQSIAMVAAFSGSQRGQISQAIKEETKKEIKVRQENRKQLKLNSAKEQFEQRKAALARQAAQAEQFKPYIGEKGFQNERTKLAAELKSARNDFKATTVSVNQSFERLNARTDKLVDEGKISGSAGSKAKGIVKGATASAGGLFGIGLIAPIIGETIAGELGRETTAGRTTAAAAQGISWATTGAMIAGPKGAIVGGIVGAFQTYSEYIGASNSMLDKTSKAAETARSDASRTVDTVQQVGTSISDYYQTVTEQGANSAAAQKKQQKVLSDLTRFGSKNTEKLTKAFLEGGDVFGELEKISTESLSKADIKTGIDEYEKVSSDIRSSQSDIFKKVWNSTFWGKYPEPEDKDIKNLAAVWQKLNFGDAQGQDLIKAVQDAGGVKKFANAFGDTRSALNEFQDALSSQFIYPTDAIDLEGGMKAAENILNDPSLGADLKAKAQAYMDALDRNLKDARATMERGGNQLDISDEEFKKIFGTIFQDPDTAAKIQSEFLKNYADAQKSSKIQANTLKKFKQDPFVEELTRTQQDILGGKGHSGIDLLQKSFQRRLGGLNDKASKLQEIYGQYAEAAFPDVFKDIEKEQKRQEAVSKKIEGIKFLKDFGVEPPGNLVRSVLGEAQQAMISEMSDLGIDMGALPAETQRRMSDVMKARTLESMGYAQEETARLQSEYRTGQEQGKIREFAGKEEKYGRPLTEQEFANLDPQRKQELTEKYNQQKREGAADKSKVKKALGNWLQMDEIAPDGQQMVADFKKDLDIQRGVFESAKTEMKDNFGMSANEALKEVERDLYEPAAQSKRDRETRGDTRLSANEEKLRYVQSLTGRNQGRGMNWSYLDLDEGIANIDMANRMLEEKFPTTKSNLPQPTMPTLPAAGPVNVPKVVTAGSAPTAVTVGQPTAQPQPVTPVNASNIPAVQSWMTRQPAVSPTGGQPQTAPTVPTTAPLLPSIPAAPATPTTPTAAPAAAPTASASENISTLSTNASKAAQALVAFQNLNNTGGNNNGQQGQNQPNTQNQGSQTAQAQRVEISLDGKLPEPKVEIASVQIDVSSLDSIKNIVSSLSSKIEGPISSLSQKVSDLETKMRGLEIRVTRA